MEYTSKLDQLEKHFEELTAQMADPAVISDGEQYRKISKAHSDLSDVVTKYRDYREASDQLAQAKAMLDESDPDMRELAELEVERLTPAITQMEEDIKLLLLPKDPLDDKDVVLEIRAGTGGRRSQSVRGRSVPHVYALRGNAAVESGGHVEQRIGRRRIEGSSGAG
jgi:peptide chain release factor 1